MFCTKCGKELADGTNFCEKCEEQPLKDLSIWGYFVKCLKNYAKFDGRARRKEYWGFYLFFLIIGFVSGAVIYAVTGSESIAQLLIVVVFLIPSWAVTVRRMHDIGKSGWSILIQMIPFIGSIIFFIWTLKDSDGDNQYGENPKVSLS